LPNCSKSTPQANRHARARAHGDASLDAHAPSLAYRRHAACRAFRCFVRGRRAAPRYAHAPTRISIKSTPIDSFSNSDPSKTRLGALEFRGGLVLTSSDKTFGGLSSLHVDADGAHFLSGTDNGSWLRGRIVYRDGRPAAIADAEIAPMLSANGRPLAARGWFDAESLASDGAGHFYVGLERVQKIVRFDYRRLGLRARGAPIAVPSDFRTLIYNQSLECLAVLPKGAPHAGELIVITERSLNAAGNHRAFILKGNRVTRFSVKRHDNFDVTDCAFLAPGALLLLERRYAPLMGVAMRIRRLHLADMKEGAAIDGRALIVADLGYQIDNMEGIAITRDARGETIITLVSDDNFSTIQRTLLLQFALVGE
jgi:hypothetical protein